MPGTLRAYWKRVTRLSRRPRFSGVRAVFWAKSDEVVVARSRANRKASCADLAERFVVRARFVVMAEASYRESPAGGSGEGGREASRRKKGREAFAGYKRIQIGEK